MLRSLKSYRTLALVTLPYTLAVILWGTFVRATGSGAGCGDHWPLCNGEMIPRSPGLETFIEFAHRFTSGILLLLMAAWVLCAFRAFAKGHPARAAVIWSAVFLVIEALIGAALVLLELVADNPSLARGWWMAAHLANTFILLGWMTLAARYGWDDSRPRLSGPWAWRFAAGLLLLIFAGSSGAVAALGNTLFPAETLAAGVRMDFDPASHLLVRLRVWHPVIAVVAAAWMAVLSALLYSHASARVRRRALAVMLFVVAQGAAGFLNLLLLAPVWMQLTHLLLADLLWMATVLLGAEVLARDGDV